VRDGVEIPAWVADDAQRAEADDALRGMVGSRVVGVRYVEIDYGEPLWAASGFDSLDYGVEFDFDDGATWSLIWQQGGHNEGIGVRKEPLVPSQLLPDARTTSWDVTKRWADAGRQVQRLETRWQRASYGASHLSATGEQVAPAGRTDLCLVTLVVRLERSPILITLGGAEPDGTFTPWNRDNIAVFFSFDVARAVGICTPDDPDW
jgi:hypothetical protein